MADYNLPGIKKPPEHYGRFPECEYVIYFSDTSITLFQTRKTFPEQIFSMSSGE